MAANVAAAVAAWPDGNELPENPVSCAISGRGRPTMYFVRLYEHSLARHDSDEEPEDGSRPRPAVLDDCDARRDEDHGERSAEERDVAEHACRQRGGVRRAPVRRAQVVAREQRVVLDHREQRADGDHARERNQQRCR